MATPPTANLGTDPASFHLTSDGAGPEVVVLPHGHVESPGWHYEITQVEKTMDVSFHTPYQNITDRDGEGIVTVTKSVGWDFSVGVSVSAEVKAGIFASIKGQVDATVTWHIDTAVSRSVKVFPKAHSTLWVDYGVTAYNILGMSYYVNEHGDRESEEYASAHAPTTAEGFKWYY